MLAVPLLCQYRGSLDAIHQTEVAVKAVFSSLFAFAFGKRQRAGVR
jgi:hypothetical protein